MSRRESSIRIAYEKLTIMPTSESRRVTTDSTLTCIAINRRGKLLAVGAQNGEIKICDALTLANIYTYIGNVGAITSISFSEDSCSLASTDTSGTLIIHDTLSTSVKMQYKFDCSIIRAEFSKRDQSKIVFLLKDGTLGVFSIPDSSITTIRTNIGVFALTCTDNVICSTKKKVVNIFPLETPDDAVEVTVKSGHMFKSIAVSPNGDYFILFDDTVANLYTKEGTHIVRYWDTCGEKFSCGCFWMDGQHIFLGGKDLQASSFRAYILGGPEMVFLDMQSARVPAIQMIANPMKPWLYVCGKKCLQVWVPSKDRLIPSCPVGQQLIANEMYEEREDEWDTTNSFEKEHNDNLFRHNVFLEEEEQDEEDDKLPGEIYELPCDWNA